MRDFGRQAVPDDRDFNLKPARSGVDE